MFININYTQYVDVEKSRKKSRSLCVAGPHVVVLFPHQVVCWPAIGPWPSAIGVAANHKPPGFIDGDQQHTGTLVPAAGCADSLTSQLETAHKYYALSLL